MEDHELCNTGRSYASSVKLGAHDFRIALPAPKNLAAADSFLNSLAEDCVLAATFATFAAASDGEGVMVRSFGIYKIDN